jgi:hypothetical protein
MSKGMILRMDRKWAYVFTSGCDLVKVRIEPRFAVGKEIRMESEEKRIRYPSPTRRWMPALATAVLAVLVGVGLLFGQGLVAPKVYATMSVDINPSLEMSLDRNLNVIAVKAMNADAEPVLATVQLRNLYWKTAVERWVEAVRATNRFQIETMLVSAVMPEDALKLQTELRTMQENPGTGIMAGIEVRALYSNDLAVLQTADSNGLSVGRQMLLTQAEVQKKNYDAARIGGAALGELVQDLLQNQEMNQTGYTWQGTRDPSGQPTGSGNGEQNQNGNQGSTPGGNQNGNGSPNPSAIPTAAANQEQNQSGGGGQNQESNGTPNPSCTPQGDKNQGSGAGGGNGTVTPACTPLADPTGAMKGR